jgi:hypothetical protein
VSIHRKRSDEARFPRGYYYDDRNRPKGLMLERRFLVLFTDGRYARMDDMVAEPVTDVAHKEVQDFLERMTSDAPKNGGYGVLISAADMDIRATEPMDARDVSTNGNRVTFQAAYHHTIILNKLMKGNGIVNPQDQDTLMFAASFRWFECKKQLTNSQILSTPGSIFRLVEHRLEKRGAQRMFVKRAGRDFVIGNDGKPVTSYKAVEKIANTYNLRVKEAAEVVTMIGAGMPVSLWRVKTAQGESLDPNAQMPMDPNMAAGMDPNAQMQAPPPPTGLDLATSEKLQQIAGQIAALQQMQQILTEVQQRAQMIDQGGGAMAAPGAAAEMMGGPGAMGGQTPMVPAPMGGGQPPMDPSQMGGGQPPMDPSQMGGAVPPGGGMVPMGAPPGPEQPPPPPPVMSEEEPSPEMLQQQVNPAFLQDAASLQDQGIFDAAAIASMGKQKNISGLIQNYLPTVEKAMDNMGRMLLLLYMKENEIKLQIGAEAYEETEQKVRDVFRGLGDSILALTQYGDQMTAQGSAAV